MILKKPGLDCGLSGKKISELKAFLDEQVLIYNEPGFIADDPVSIPHRFSKKQDVEIAGFFAAILAWGQRKTILNKCTDLLNRMDNEPHRFIMEHGPDDLKSLSGFRHRTFNETDLLYFVSFLRSHYLKNPSLESAFLTGDGIRKDYLQETGMKRVLEASAPCMAGNAPATVAEGLNAFRRYFFSKEDFPARTVKHISSPLQGSTCKRLNMYLRWMVRRDNCGVDFGIWQQIDPSQLICPCDVHVNRVARALGLITRKQTDWNTALELTENLRKLDREDPVKYDFALFGIGVGEKILKNEVF